MCGINGIIKFKGGEAKEIFAMNEAIKHRGPDDRGVYIWNENNYSIALGHLRLAILDLTEKGHQPMGVEMKSQKLIYRDEGLNTSDYSVVFNGEIYNFQEIRDELEKRGWKFESTSDTEVLLKGFIEWGESVIQKFNGMFAFVIYDKKNHKLFGARDRIGKKPLKYYLDDNYFAFSSELKALLTLPIQRDLDFEAVNDYLTLQYVPSPKTGFKNIFKLPQAHFFWFDIKTKKLDIKRYWDIDYSEKSNLSFIEAGEKLETLIKESVDYRLIADVEVGAFLSGGVDSSAVVAFASQSKQKLKTFNIRFDNEKFDESSYAELTAKRYGTDHHVFTVTENDMLSLVEKIAYQFEEPFADVSALPSYILSEKTAQHVTVALNGDGGDENFGGYDKYNIHLRSQALAQLPLTELAGFTLEKINKILNNSKIDYLSTLLRVASKKPEYKHYNFTKYFDINKKKQLIAKELKNNYDVEKIQKFEEIVNDKKFDFLDLIFYLDFNSYVPDDLMPKVDIATMAFGLESRSPLLDYRIVEFAASLPYSYKIDKTGRKKIFKNVLEKYVDKDILYRSKKGFSVPVDDWFRNELKGFIAGSLTNNKAISSSLFNMEYIKTLLAQHDKGKNNGKMLWSLLILNLWAKSYNVNF